MVVGEFTEDVDVVILGGGPAGYTAAFALATSGRGVVVVDANGSLGGTCLHTGCIGSKTLLHTVCERGMSLDEAAAQTASHVDTLSNGLAARAKALGVRVVKGTARFADRRTVQVASDTVGRLRFKRAIVCTGGWSDAPEGHLTPAQVMRDPTCLTGTVCVTGSSTDALEAAALAAAAGCTVTLACPGKVLPGVPDALSKNLVRSLRRSIAIVDSPVDADVNIDARANGGDCAALDLHVTQVCTSSDGWIDVDDTMQTTDTRVLAAGRCTGRSPYAGAALRMGAVAASTLLGDHDAFDPAAEPVCLWTTPGLCWCGPDTLEGLSQVSVPWGHSGQAVLRGEAATGRTVLAWDPDTGIVHGAGAVGGGAPELAEAFTLAVELAATLDDLAACVPAHPTRAELLGEAARQALAS